LKQVIVRPAAAADIEDAYQWYEVQRPGLGEGALSVTRNRVLEQPEAFPVLHRNTRRALIPQRFPYGLFYRVYGDTIVIVACLHAKRDPRRWQRRT
jgi:plasmid stabilization system protein ParE